MDGPRYDLIQGNNADARARERYLAAEKDAARLQDQLYLVQQENRRLQSELHNAQESALFFARALRECLDLAYKRAHKQIAVRIKDALGNHI